MPCMVFSWSPVWGAAADVQDYTVLLNKFPIVYPEEPFGAVSGPCARDCGAIAGASEGVISCNVR